MGLGMANQLYLFNMANQPDPKRSPEDELLETRAKESARQSWLERHPVNGSLRVAYRPLKQGLEPLSSPSSSSSSRFVPKQAYAILTHSDSDEPTTHSDIRRRLNDAVKYANMPKALVPGLPADFTRARAAYDSLLERLRRML